VSYSDPRLRRPHSQPSIFLTQTPPLPHRKKTCRSPLSRTWVRTASHLPIRHSNRIRRCMRGIWPRRVRGMRAGRRGGVLREEMGKEREFTVLSRLMVPGGTVPRLLRVSMNRLRWRLLRLPLCLCSGRRQCTVVCPNRPVCR
jgi:hypothetical protein